MTFLDFQHVQRSVLYGPPGRRGRTKSAFTHGDVFASMFSSYLCGGDCIDDVMDIKPFWDNRKDIRVCSSDVILRTLRNLSGDSVTYEGGRHYDVTSFQFYSMLPEMRLRLVVKRSQSRRDQADKDAARNLTGVAAALEAIEKSRFLDCITATSCARQDLWKSRNWVRCA